MKNRFQIDGNWSRNDLQMRIINGLVTALENKKYELIRNQISLRSQGTTPKSPVMIGPLFEQVT